MPFWIIFTIESGRTAPPCIPLPKILSIPKLPKAETAPVAKCGAILETPLVKKGVNFSREVHKLHPCLIDFLIEDLEKEISAPVLFFLAFCNFAICLGESNNSSFPLKEFFPSRNFKADPSLIAFASLAFCPWDKFTLYS